MKNLIIILLSFISFGNVAVFAQTSITKTKHGDTLIEYRVDTLNNFIGLKNHYKPSADAVQAFKSHFVSKTVSPGDKSNPVYKQYITRGNKLAENAKAQAILSLKNDPTRIASTELKNVDEISACSFIPIPVYFLTHNVVNYINETNMTSFFTLDTSNITYKIEKNKHVVGIMQYKKGRGFFWHFSGLYLREYHQILSMNKEPLIFVKRIAIPESLSTNEYGGFGYVGRGHIIFVNCAEGEYSMVGPGAKPGQLYYGKNYTLKSAEAFYLGSDSGMPNLDHYINNENGRLKKQPKE
jgi:hypothetical protein